MLGPGVRTMPSETSAKAMKVPIVGMALNPSHYLSNGPFAGLPIDRHSMASSLCRANLGNNLLCGIAEVVGGDDRQAAHGENVLALLDVGAFEADNQRHRQLHFAGGFDDPLRDDVAAHDAAEDIDEDTLHRRIAQDDLERRGDLFLVRAATDVE